MVDQPGAGGSRSYKIRGYTRERQSAKPYARPPGRKKGVIETVKDFFSPAWLVDFFKGNQIQPIEIEDADDEYEHNEVSQTIEESYSSNSNVRSSREPTEVSTATKVGNGRLGSSFGPGYFSPILRERELSSETPSISRPSRTFGLSSGDDHFGEPSTSTARSGEFNSEVPSSRRVDESVQLETVVEQEEELSILHADRQRRSKSGSIMTSTPALFLNPGSKRRANTSIFGEPLPIVQASASGRANKSKPQLFPPSSESRPGPQPYSIPKNRPFFSVSAFGSPMPPKPLQAGGFSSPFYRGKTSFGGASSLHSSGYKRVRTNSPTLGEALQSVRTVITPKPFSSAGSSGVTSQTAKRILEALENMSSPLIDARKIPTPPVSPSASPLSFSPAKRRRTPMPSRAVGSPHSLKAHFPGPPVQDLSAPQQASISKLRAKETVSPESTATSSASLFSTATTTIPTFSKPSVPSFSSTPLPISLSPSSSNAKVGGKVKSARSTGHYTQRDRSDGRSESEVVNPIPEVTTAIPLPLPNGKFLPSFSFTPTSQNGTANSTTNEMSFSTAITTASVDLTKNNFKFSAPATKVAFSQDSSAASQGSSNKITFSFSQPAPVSKSDTVSDNKSATDKQGKSFVVKAKQTDKPMEPNNNLFNKCAPLAGSWECETCLVSNKGTETKCVACQSSKPSTGKPVPKKPASTSNNLIQKFAPAAGSWDCDSCMLSNDASRTKCVACETSKPGSKPAMVSSKLVVNSDTDLMKKFAPASDSWSCDTCMLQNKSTDSNCVSCQSPKPSAPSAAKTTVTPSFGVPTNATSDSLAAKFAPPSGSWDCDTCMLTNKGEDSTCVACQTPKPGAKPTATSTTGGFSLPGSSTFSSSPFKFGVNNSSGANFSSGSSLKFGVDTKTTGESTVPFTFGSSAADQNSKSDSNQAEGTSKLDATIRFRASPSQTSDSKAGETKSSSAPMFGFRSSAVNRASNDDSAKGPGLSFGVSSSSDKDNTITGGFTLGNSQASTNKDKLNKVPEMKEPARTMVEQSSSQTGSGMSIADAAKSGLLKVPTADGKKDDFASPPNVNLFAPSQSVVSGSSTTKPQTGSGVAFTAPKGAPPPYPFGSTTPASSAAGSGALGQGLGAAASPFTLPANTAAPATTTAAAPFSFLANTPAATPAVPFSFGSNAVSTAAAATTFQFAQSATGSLKPEQAATSTSAPLFQFGAANTALVTSSAQPEQAAPSTSAQLFQFSAANTASVSSSAQPAQQTFGITSKPASSSSETAKPFAFNAGSTAQGFSFAPSNPAATFSFGGSAPKQESTFPAFGAAQTSSNQQASATPFMFATSSNSTPTPSEETMEADGNNSATNLFVSPANAAAGAPFGSTGPTAGFSFGAPNVPSAGGFNFVAAAQTNTGSNTLAFGASPAPAANAPAPGGFNFGAAATTNNIGSPGMFNFGGGGVAPQGNNLFTAGTGGDNSAIAQRKMKRAVRRTKR